MDGAGDDRKHRRDEKPGKQERLIDEPISDRVDPDVVGGFQQRQHDRITPEVKQADHADEADEDGVANERLRATPVEAHIDSPKAS